NHPEARRNVSYRRAFAKKRATLRKILGERSKNSGRKVKREDRRTTYRDRLEGASYGIRRFNSVQARRRSGVTMEHDGSFTAAPRQTRSLKSPVRQRRFARAVAFVAHRQAVAGYFRFGGRTSDHGSAADRNSDRD